ncbi:MAG: hypothetical protein ABEI97_05125, partial [Candidatus Nanohaloarchaea archaeon]
LRAFPASRSIEIRHNGEPLRTVTATVDGNTVSIDLPETRGPHALQFDFTGRCRTPAAVEDTEDRRCLAWAVNSVQVN